MTTFPALCCEMVDNTASRISAAVLHNLIKFQVAGTTHTHFACSSAKPLWVSMDEGIPGKREVSSGLRMMSASVARARLKV